jgi:hypothetical protein
MARWGGAPLLSSILVVLGAGLAVGAADTSPRVAIAAVQQVPSGFTHADHEVLQCFTCHENAAGHGALIVTTIEDCRSCHHASETAAPCARCHEESPGERFEMAQPVAFSVPAADARRIMAFPHDRHADLDCAGCHTQGTALSVPDDLDCASCHEDHHETTSDCASCHAPVHASAHPPSEVHVTCSGAACHQDVPFESVPRTRAFCLGCHGDMRLHEAPRDCVECHILPAPRGS